jgi:hypothetical protein
VPASWSPTTASCTVWIARPLSITRLFAAVAALADNLSALASSVAEANGHLRGRLSLDAPAEELPALDHQPAEGNGTPRRKRQTS